MRGTGPKKKWRGPVFEAAPRYALCGFCYQMLRVNMLRNSDCAAVESNQL